MSDTPRPPPTTVKVEPGESPFLALAREVAARPDGVVALKLMSHMNGVMAPRQQAIEALVDALATLIDAPDSETAQADVDAATARWEAACDSKMDPGLLQGFREDALTALQRRKNGPPEMRTILKSVAPPPDFGYEMAGDLTGMKGIWHRLWALLCLERQMSFEPEESGVAQLREELEAKLGRPLEVVEWSALVAHAHRHADTVMRRT